MNNVVLDVETTKLPYIYPWQHESALVSVAVCDQDGKRKTWFFNHPAATQTTRECIDEIQGFLNKYDRLIGHNLMFDLHWLVALGINTNHMKLWCTMVVEYLIRGHQKLQGLKLKELADYYKIPQKKDTVQVYWDADIDTPRIPAKTLQVYGEQDCVTAMAVFKKQTPQVNKLNLQSLVSLEMGVLRCYQAMEMNGMKLDLEHAEQLRCDADERLDEIDREITELLDIHNPGSPEQLSVGLFGGKYQIDGRVPGKRPGTTKQGKVDVRRKGLGFDPKRLKIPENKKDGIYSISKDTLPLLRGRTADQKKAIKLLTERSALAQLRKMYYNKLTQIHVDGFLHPSVNQATTKTGRTSCERPNLQNLPRDNNGPVKRCFVTRYGDEGAILDVDLAQIEWRVVADLTGDPVMIDEIVSGRDQHAYTCQHHMEMEVTKENRTNAKIFNFRAIYINPDVAAFAYYMDTGMPNFSRKKWKNVVDGFFSHYSGMVNAHTQWESEVARNGQYTGPTGRIWKFEKEAKYYWGYSPNKIRNYRVQGSAGDLIKLALCVIWHRVCLKYPDVKLCMAVHDSIIFDLPKNLVDEVARICIDVFEELPKLAKKYFDWTIKVPITGDAACGPSWGEAKEIEI